MDEAEALCDRVGDRRSRQGDRARHAARADRVARRRARRRVRAGRRRRRSIDDGARGACPACATCAREDGDVRAGHRRKLHLAVPALLASSASAGADAGAADTHSATLEDVFVTLTGRHLRDADCQPRAHERVAAGRRDAGHPLVELTLVALPRVPPRARGRVLGVRVPGASWPARSASRSGSRGARAGASSAWCEQAGARAGRRPRSSGAGGFTRARLAAGRGRSRPARRPRRRWSSSPGTPPAYRFDRGARREPGGAARRRRRRCSARPAAPTRSPPSQRPVRDRRARATSTGWCPGCSA